MTNDITSNEINQWTDCIAFVVSGWVVGSICIMINNSLTILTKNVDVFITNQFMDFYIGTIIRTNCQRTIQHEFHIASTRCFLRCKRNLFGNICCWDNITRLGYIVVFNHHHLQMRGNIWVILNNL